MTFDELEESLPNGLHDAELLGVQIDYSHLNSAVELNIDVGTGTSTRSTYRRGRVVFTGVRYVAIDAPAVNVSDARVSRINAGSGEPTTAAHPLPKCPADTFLCWLFVVDWNSFIRIAARSVALEWSD